MSGNGYTEVYTTVDIDALAADIRRAIAAGHTIGFDVETHGPEFRHLKARKPDFTRHHIVGYGVAIPALGVLAYVPLRHTVQALVKSRPEYVRTLRLLRFCLHPAARVAAHNWTAEAQLLINEGVGRPRCVQLDSMVLAWMRGMRLPGEGGLKLKPLMAAYYNQQRPGFADVVQGRAVPDVPPEILGPYCCADAHDCAVLADRCWSELSEEERRDYLDVEMPSLEVTRHMVAVGVPLDVPALEAMAERARARMADLADRFERLTRTTVMEPTKVRRPRRCDHATHLGEGGMAVPCPAVGCVAGILHFKNGKPKLETVEELAPVERGALISSDQQVERWLWRELRWWPTRGAVVNEKSRRYSTKADHISLFRLLPGEAGFAAWLRLEYQRAAKYASQYTTALVELARQSGDGRLHTSYLMTGTATGRYSSSFPNIANIPRKGAL